MATRKSTPTAVVPAGSNLPTSLRDQIAAENKALAARIQAPGGDKIKLTKDKNFKLPDGTKSPGPMTVVVLDFVSVNKFYDRPYDEKEITPAACYAVGNVISSLAPVDASPAKQAETCSECPNNEFGSKGRGKACSNTRLLAVVAGAGDSALDPKSPMWLLEVSPTGIKAWDAYVSSVRTQFNVPPIGVITEISFDPNVDYQTLRFGNPQPNPNLEMHWGRKAAAAERLASLPDFSSYQPVKAPAGKAKRK